MFYGFEVLSLEYLRLLEREWHQVLHSKLPDLRVWIGDEAYQLQAMLVRLLQFPSASGSALPLQVLSAS